MSTGAASAAIVYIRNVLAPVFAALKWELLTADGEFAAWNLLFTPGESGICVISWNGDAVQSQAGRSLVTNLRLSVTISGRRHLQDAALGKLKVTEADGKRLMEIHDKVKGAMLGLSLPSEIIAESIAAVPTYRGAVPLTAPNGIPLDALRQSWELELKESYSPVA